MEGVYRVTQTILYCFAHPNLSTIKYDIIDHKEWKVHVVWAMRDDRRSHIYEFSLIHHNSF